MKVFLSSTYIDLIEHRKAAHDHARPTVTMMAIIPKSAQSRLADIGRLRTAKRSTGVHPRADNDMQSVSTAP